jgi:hypothetical protein
VAWMAPGTPAVDVNAVLGGIVRARRRPVVLGAAPAQVDSGAQLAHDTGLTRADPVARIPVVGEVRDLDGSGFAERGCLDACPHGCRVPARVLRGCRVPRGRCAGA